jgi:hypothetical protein
VFNAKHLVICPPTSTIMIWSKGQKGNENESAVFENSSKDVEFS